MDRGTEDEEMFRSQKLMGLGGWFRCEWEEIKEGWNKKPQGVERRKGAQNKEGKKQYKEKENHSLVVAKK